jgi:hypothetical protein
MKKLFFLTAIILTILACEKEENITIMDDGGWNLEYLTGEWFNDSNLIIFNENGYIFDTIVDGNLYTPQIAGKIEIITRYSEMFYNEKRYIVQFSGGSTYFKSYYAKLDPQFNGQYAFKIIIIDGELRISDLEDNIIETFYRND